MTCEHCGRGVRSPANPEKTCKWCGVLRATPGPWELTDSDRVNACGLWKQVVASFEVTTGNEVRTYCIVAEGDVASFERLGSAQLMAAAPDLLAVAHAALIDWEAQAIGADRAKWPALFARLDAAKAAIAKAEGRSCSA